jgi:branched-subunit amino acid permease
MLKLYLLSILWNKDMSRPSITYFHIVSSLFSPYFFSTFCEEDAITTLSYKTFFFILGSFSNYLRKTSLEHPFFLSMPTSLIIYHFGVSLSSTNVSNETWPHILQIHNSITFLCIP